MMSWAGTRFMHCVTCAGSPASHSALSRTQPSLWAMPKSKDSSLSPSEKLGALIWARRSGAGVTEALGEAGAGHEEELVEEAAGNRGEAEEGGVDGAGAVPSQRHLNPDLPVFSVPRELHTLPGSPAKARASLWSQRRCSSWSGKGPCLPRNVERRRGGNGGPE